MTSLIYYVPGQFRSMQSTHRDVKIWTALFTIFTSNVSFIDRSNSIKIPFRTTSTEYTTLPVVDSNFNLSFDDCSIARAEEIYAQHLKHNVKIKLSWSGGTDSSAALMAFISLLGLDTARKSIDIVMTQKSITENPYIWERIIRPGHFNLIHAMEFTEKWDGSEIIVNGEGGDQVHGSDIYRYLRQDLGRYSLDVPWSRDIILSYIKSRTPLLDNVELEVLVDVLIDIVKNSPVKIETLGDFWWWINFSCKWSSIVYRLVAKSPRPVNDIFLKEYYFPFYTSNLFQQWAMIKRHEAHQGDWESFKWKAKEFIIKESGCPELANKHRQGSLFHLLTHTSKFEGIDNNFTFYKDLNPTSWYDPENSFKKRIEYYAI